MTAVKVKRKYNQRDNEATKKKVARCGHVTKIARYFECENCKPELEEDDEYPENIYFTSNYELEDEEVS